MQYFFVLFSQRCLKTMKKNNEKLLNFSSPNERIMSEALVRAPLESGCLTLITLSVCLAVCLSVHRHISERIVSTIASLLKLAIRGRKFESYTAEFPILKVKCLTSCNNHLHEKCSKSDFPSGISGTCSNYCR